MEDKKDLLKEIVLEAFDLEDWLRGSASGGIDAPRIILSVERPQEDTVLVKWTEAETCGLSDCRYTNIYAGVERVSTYMIKDGLLCVKTYDSQEFVPVFGFDRYKCDWEQSWFIESVNDFYNKFPMLSRFPDHCKTGTIYLYHFYEEGGHFKSEVIAFARKDKAMKYLTEKIEWFKTFHKADVEKNIWCGSNTESFICECEGVKYTWEVTEEFIAD